jgi:hypothetical protein
MAVMEAPRNPSRRPFPAHPAPRKPSAESYLRDGCFIAEATLAAWLRAGELRREGAILTTQDGRRFVLQEAVRVLGRNNGASDPYGFTGQVDSIRELVRKGATIAGDTLRLGPATYDVEYGATALLFAAGGAHS